MKKIIVIGCPGSGKSTFSRVLHEATGIRLFHLDMMYWNADKTTVEKPVFRERLIEVLRKEEWIIDGNYASTMELRMQACDTVFFLDYPTKVCLEGIRSRRGKARADMPWTQEGEEDAEFIRFVEQYQTQSRPKVIELLRRYSEKTVIVLKSRGEADEFLAMFRRYGDMLFLPHHVSATRPQMPLIDRAAQFSPFAALVGYDAAIKETARQTDAFIELDENSRVELEPRLRWLADHRNERPAVEITYYLPDKKKSGGTYVTTTGWVKKIDECERCIVMEDQTVIPIEKIYEISGQVFAGMESPDLP